MWAIGYTIFVRVAICYPSQLQVQFLTKSPVRIFASEFDLAAAVVENLDLDFHGQGLS